MKINIKLYVHAHTQTRARARVCIVRKILCKTTAFKNRSATNTNSKVYKFYFHNSRPSYISRKQTR